jgi:Protein of unknown function (DUF3396)
LREAGGRRRAKKGRWRVTRVVVTVGPEPEAGEDGRMPPAYRELARVLEPWLFHEKYLPDSTLTADELRRWERRLLD